MTEKVDWLVPLETPLCFPLAEYDRWSAFLWRPFGGGGQRQTPGEPFFLEYTTPSLTSRLWLIWIRDGMLAPVVVGLGEQEEDQIEPWRHAVAGATKALDLPDETFAWRAVLGPSAFSMNHCLVELAAPTKVGPLELRPGGVCQVNFAPPQFPQYGSRTVLPCWPFFVEGLSRGYNWNSATTHAAHDMHRLANLVSLAWDAHWDVQHSPAQIERALGTIPQHDAFLDAAKIGKHQENSHPQQLPPWVSDAWQLLDDDPVLANALDAHHEGLALREEHPSLAVVAFVAAIESIGAKDKPPERCKHCKGFPGARERFRTGLRRVMAEDRVRAIPTEVYERRSETAHSGALHGSERHRGALPYFGFFSRPAEHDFTWMTARRVAEASRSVLLDVVSRGTESRGVAG